MPPESVPNGPPRSLRRFARTYAMPRREKTALGIWFIGGANSMVEVGQKAAMARKRGCHNVQAGVPCGLYGPSLRLLIGAEHPFVCAIQVTHEPVDRYGHLQDQVSHGLLLVAVLAQGRARSTSSDSSRSFFLAACPSVVATGETPATPPPQKARQMATNFTSKKTRLGGAPGSVRLWPAARRRGRTCYLAERLPSLARVTKEHEIRIPQLYCCLGPSGV